MERIAIGALSKHTGTNIETIRYYERVGLLPAPARRSGGYRTINGGRCGESRSILRGSLPFRSMTNGKVVCDTISPRRFAFR